MQTEKMREKTPLLLYPPLIEAIFELHWELAYDKEKGQYCDISYPMMYGRIYERLKKDFPFIEDLPSTQLLPEASPYLVRHRMRKEKDGYPLVQIGPGIITVNEAKGYSWKSFSSNVLKLVDSVIDFYPEQGHPLRFIRCEIRFLNAVPIEPKNENPLAFLEEKLHTRIELDPDFFIANQLDLQPHSVNLNLGYDLQKPKGSLGLNVQLGKMNEIEAYVFQILIQSIQQEIPSDHSSLESWLNQAHSVAENTFCTFCKGFLMEKFCGL